MSKLECRKCGYEGTDWRCPNCDRLIIATSKNPTVFDKITASEEAAAEKLVYYDCDACDDNGIGYPWCSTLFADGGHFETEEKAITATVEELKKEYKG